MKKLSKLTDAKPGDTITFVYNGGSDPGKVRRVSVEEIKGNYLNGRDLDRQGVFRRYLAKLASGVEVEEAGGSVVHFATAQKNVAAAITQLSSEKLTELYATLFGGTDKDVKFDVATGNIVVKEKDTNKFRVQMNGSDGCTLSIDSDEGVVLANIRIFNGDRSVSFNGKVVTPKELVEKLVEALDNQ